jgi:hypothetical protein
MSVKKVSDYLKSVSGMSWGIFVSVIMLIIFISLFAKKGECNKGFAYTSIVFAAAFGILTSQKFLKWFAKDDVESTILSVGGKTENGYYY